MPKLSVKAWATLALIVLLVLALLGWRAGCQAANSAKADRNQAVATGEALDRVADETADTRQDQKEKEDAVEKIAGADERLPDGFGADLERVRRGGERRNP